VEEGRAINFSQNTRLRGGLREVAPRNDSELARHAEGLPERFRAQGFRARERG